MTEKFIYLSNPYRSDRIPVGTCEAGYHDGVLYPSNPDSKGKTFIRGIGWVKLKKVKEIPVYDNTYEGWDKYLNEYGKHCLYYSITGGDLNDWDCCTDKQRQEFNSILFVDIDNYVEFTDAWKRLNEIQRSVLEKYETTKNDFFTNKYYFKPSYNLAGCFYLPYYPNMDVVADDQKLFEAYSYITEEKYKQSDSKYMELRNKPIKDMTDAEEDYCIEFSKKCNLFVREKLNSFTECMKDRISIIYGEEATELYEKLMHVCVPPKK
jgi:hypothetical protein